MTNRATVIRGAFPSGLLLRLVLCAAAVAATLPVGSAAQSSTALLDRVWFAPGPGTLDYLRLFEHPEEWTYARRVVRVFKFYQGHLLTSAPPNVGPNTYEALIQVDAFRRLHNWGIKIGLEAGSVKEFYCTPDASGMNQSIQNTLRSLDDVQRAG